MDRWGWAGTHHRDRGGDGDDVLLLGEHLLRLLADHPNLLLGNDDAAQQLLDLRREGGRREAIDVSDGGVGSVCWLRERPAVGWERAPARRREGAHLSIELGVRIIYPGVRHRVRPASISRRPPSLRVKPRRAGPAPRRSAAMRGLDERAPPDGWISRAVSRRFERTPGERLRREFRNARGDGHDRTLRASACAVAAARVAGSPCQLDSATNVWTRRGSFRGETAGKKCTRRMDDQSLNNVALRFAHPPNSAPSEPLVEGKVRRPESGPSWRALQAATLGEGRTGGRDRQRAIMPIPPINSLVKYDHPVQVRRPPARVSRLPPIASFETRPGAAESSIRAVGDPVCGLSRATRPCADASPVSSRRRSPPRRISGSPEGPRYASAPPSLARTRPTT